MLTLVKTKLPVKRLYKALYLKGITEWYNSIATNDEVWTKHKADKLTEEGIDALEVLKTLTALQLRVIAAITAGVYSKGCNDTRNRLDRINSNIDEYSLVKYAEQSTTITEVTNVINLNDRR